MRQVLRALIVAALILPFLSLLFFIEKLGFPPIHEVFRATLVTIVQSGLSAVFSLGFGAAGALGLLKLRRLRAFFEIFILIPNFLPSIFVILAGLNLISPFPFGISGVVLLHSAVNIGLVSVLLARIFENKAGGYIELARIEGASKLQIFLTCFFGALKRDVLLIFLLVFSLCFSSFAIPLTIGGTKHLTLEMLLYEKIRISGAWGEAFGLALFESLLIYLIALFLLREGRPESTNRKDVFFLGSKVGLVVPFVISSALIFGLMKGSGLGWQQLQGIPQLKDALIRTALGSLSVSFAVGFLTLFFLAMVSFLIPHRRFQNFLASYKAPSTVITGFGFLVIGLAIDSSEWRKIFQFVAITMALALGFLPTLYRMECEGQLKKIENQILTARVLGASWLLIFLKVVWPQILGTLGFLAGIAAFWAAGDFALSSILSGEDFSLALVIQSLMGSYRLELATLLQWVLLAVGTVSFLFFWSLRYVYREKSV